MKKAFNLLLLLIVGATSQAQLFTQPISHLRYGAIYFPDTSKVPDFFRPTEGEIFYGDNVNQNNRLDPKKYLTFKSEYDSHGLLKETLYLDRYQQPVNKIELVYENDHWLSKVKWYDKVNGLWEIRRTICYIYTFGYEVDISTLEWTKTEMPINVKVIPDQCEWGFTRYGNNISQYSNIVWHDVNHRKIKEFEFYRTSHDGKRKVAHKYVSRDYNDSGYVITKYSIKNDTAKMPTNRVTIKQGASGEVVYEKHEYYSNYKKQFILHYEKYFDQVGSSFNLNHETGYIRYASEGGKYQPAKKIVYKQQESSTTEHQTSQALNTLQLFPTMASKLLNISIPDIEFSIGNLQVVDIRGGTVVDFVIEEDMAGTNYQLDVSNYADGPYLVKFQNDNSIYTGKFIKRE